MKTDGEEFVRPGIHWHLLCAVPFIIIALLLFCCNPDRVQLQAGTDKETQPSPRPSPVGRARESVRARTNLPPLPGPLKVRATKLPPLPGALATNAAPGKRDTTVPEKKTFAAQGVYSVAFPVPVVLAAAAPAVVTASGMDEDFSVFVNPVMCTWWREETNIVFAFCSHSNKCYTVGCKVRLSDAWKELAGSRFCPWVGSNTAQYVRVPVLGSGNMFYRVLAD